jgi:hypothetical protein
MITACEGVRDGLLTETLWLRNGDVYRSQSVLNLANTPLYDDRYLRWAYWWRAARRELRQTIYEAW